MPDKKYKPSYNLTINTRIILNTHSYQKFFVPLMILYLGGLLISLLVLVFPGAKIFYKTIRIDNESLRFDGTSIHFQIPLDRRIYNPESILVLEDGKILIRSYTDDPRYRQEGTFFLQEGFENELPVMFIPTENIARPIQERVFEILIRPNILSGNIVGQFSVILLTGMIVTLGIVRKKINLRTMHPFQGVDKPYYEVPESLIENTTKLQQPHWRESLLRAFVDIVIFTFFFIFMEWLFLVTKPSFMDYFPFWEKVRIFLVTSVLMTIIAVILLFIFFSIGVVVSRLRPQIGRYFIGIPLAFFATCLSFLLLDNFLNTVLSFGVAGSSAPVRILFSIGFVTLFLYFLFKIVDRYSSLRFAGEFHIYKWLSLGILVFSLPLFFSRVSAKVQSQGLPLISLEKENPPNIILISSDGLNSSNLSLYGYERDTTPFLRELAETSLVSENNFPNTDHSLGSETSLLTGRFPFITGVLFSPDILQGDDRFFHLPGMLRHAGYKTVSLGVPYYIDANNVNLRSAFDEVNCIEKGHDLSLGIGLSENFEPEQYLLYQIQKRVTERLLHIFFLRDIKSAIATVNDVSGYTVSDQARLQCLRGYLAEAKKSGQPVFIHMHQMGTHGPTFETTIQRFSFGEEQDQIWMTDFYDDTIINFDSDIANLVKYIKTLGLYENTVIAIYTDHGTEWTNSKRLPLLIHFPGGGITGRIHENTQNMDIPPTILDYLGMKIPDWMDGSSLLSPIPPTRTIFSVEPVEPVQVSGLWTMPKKTAELPFKQLSVIDAIQCQRITSIDLENLSVEESNVEAHTAPCSIDSLDTREEIINEVGKLLLRAGFQLPEDWNNLNN
jgi:hypothetical protein